MRGLPPDALLPLAGAGLDGWGTDFAGGGGSFLEAALAAGLPTALDVGLGDFFETDLVATDFCFDLLAIMDGGAQSAFFWTQF